MRQVLFNAFIFTVGAAIGSTVTWKLVKSKYEQIAQEEIDSVKEVFERRRKEESKDNDAPIEDQKEDASALQETVTNLGYISNIEKEGGDEMTKKPYVISPDEFDELDYEIVSLTYYADGYLADEFDELVDDIDETIGLESLNTFGKYEDDSVFVRNDELEKDYEILLDSRNYKDVVDPPQRDDY